MRVSAEDLNLEPGVYIREGCEMLAQLRDQWVMLPELSELHPQCDIDQADVGVPGRPSPEDESRMRAILKHHRKIFLGDGNPAPAPARGVVCDFDEMPNLSHCAQCQLDRMWQLRYTRLSRLKKLLENNLIEHSESQWASPIGIVLKKNGVDIRMCIDYRLVNNFIQLSSYPLPLIDDLLVGFEKALWFMSLDMASGFWAIKMTERASLRMSWIRMPFGLKNAPLIYQQVINNCLWGFVRLPPEEEAEVDQEVLDYLNLDPQDDGSPGCGTPRCSGCENDHASRLLPTLADQMTVFKRNIPAPTQMSPVL
ncbi:LOW QUALITY PROTEIN: reverse transcriptase, partial [Phytophthora megakarya]